MRGSPKDDALGDFARGAAARQKASSQTAHPSGSDGALERLLIILPTGESTRLRVLSPSNSCVASVSRADEHSLTPPSLHANGTSILRITYVSGAIGRNSASPPHADEASEWNIIIRTHRANYTAEIVIDIPGFGKQDGDTPIVILGPNGSGKTQLAQKIARAQNACAISAQRRTCVDDNLPVQEEQNLRNNTRSQQDRWWHQAWQPVEDINFILSTLIQDHTNLLPRSNEQAIAANAALQPVRDTKLMQLQGP